MRRRSNTPSPGWRQSQSICATWANLHLLRLSSDLIPKSKVLVDALSSVMGAIPVYEPRNADLDRCRRLETEIASAGLNIGIGRRHVARLKRLEAYLGFSSECVLEHGNEFGQLFRTVIAEIVQRVRRTSGWRTIQHTQDAVHDVIDISEIAPHLTMVENRDRLARKDRAGGDEKGHVRPSPWTLDGEKTQARGRKPVEMCIGESDEFVGALGRGIERIRFIHRILDRERQFLVAAI